MKSSALSLFILLVLSLSTRAHSNQCNNILYTTDFSSSIGWQSEGNEDVYIGDGNCRMQNASCGYYNRVYYSIDRPLSETYWSAECDFSILTENPPGHGTGVVVMALTAGTLDFMSYDLAQNYEETYQDGISVVLMSDGSVDNDINNWFFMIEAKKGNYRTFDLSSVIYANSSIPTYYIRLERTSMSGTQLSIFSDSTFTGHLPGSPVSFGIDPDISRLYTIQHGVMTPGYYSRLINGAVDNDLVCDDFFNTSNSLVMTSGVTPYIFPNPSSSIIHVKKSELINFSPGTKYSIINSMGKELVSSVIDATGEVDISRLFEGVFILMITESRKTFLAPIIKVY
jgi:hypothetical protein